MSHNKTIKEAKDTISSLTSGTLIQFSQQAHYSKNKDTRDYAIISSIPTPEKNHKWYAISNAFTHLHKCSIIWNNEEHTALIYYEKNYPKRLYLKIQYGSSNVFAHISSHLPILSWFHP